MKNFIKSLLKREKAPEGYNKRHLEEASTQVIPTGNTKEIIEQIHREFFSASEEIVREARQIINNLPQTNASKAERLRAIGFGNTQEAVEDKQKHNAEEKANTAIETALYFTNAYPMYRYIDDAAIDRICKKYNLVFGESNRYKGFIPDKNLKDIEAFKIKEEDCFYGHEWRSFIDYRTMLTEDSYQRYINQRSNSPIPYHHDSITKLIDTLYICAPLKDMDMTNARLDGRRIIEYPDPIVLRRVRGGGYLIITAWGDEASDPEVVNSKMN